MTPLNHTKCQICKKMTHWPKQGLAPGYYRVERQVRKLTLCYRCLNRWERAKVDSEQLELYEQ